MLTLLLSLLAMLFIAFVYVFVLIPVVFAIITNVSVSFGRVPDVTVT